MDTHVLVGVDGGPQALAAARYAVHAAAIRKIDLLVAHGSTMPVSTLPMPAELVDTVLVDAHALVDRVVAQLNVPPTMVVERLVETAPALALLRRMATNAELVVVGQDARGLVERLVQGNITSALAAQATCPVVVVPAYPPADARRPVTVALDGETAAESALRFAFDEAALRQVELTVLHATPLDCLPSEALEDEVTLAEILASWKADRPDVDVRTVVLPGDPAELIVAASRHAGLMVVGRPHASGRMRRHLPGHWSRSVAKAVVDRSQCPLTVVPTSSSPGRAAQRLAKAAR